jgi:hypothetical protein
LDAGYWILDAGYWILDEKAISSILNPVSASFCPNGFSKETATKDPNFTTKELTN